MSLISKRPLLVLNASAGSGKTYNLVRNYLVLLLKESAEKADLGQIVAMTFTNKAAYEMKTRIIRDLNKLSNPSANDQAYVKEIAQLTGQELPMLQRNARIVLRKMLHRYEEFNVLTIDKFNLKLIRSFSRDLNLPEQFDIVLDEQLILEKAVDELLSTIDKNAENRIYRLAINFATTNLDEETKWDVKRALMDSAQILTDERSYQVITKLVEKEFSQAEYDLWRLQYKEHNLDIQRWQQRIQLALEQSGLQMDQLAGKSTTWNKIQKIVQEKGTAKTKLETFETKDSFLNNLEKTAEKTGQNEPYFTIRQFADYWAKLQVPYFELELKVKQFYLLSILRELAVFMENIREKDAVIRVSEFNKLVSELVKDEEAPFIYERLGNRFRHFFLDEFQDTSRLQWMNLVPLVHESLGHGQFNLIVGDPKQSIYRFKNGVAEQFVALPRIYNPEGNPSVEQKSDFFEEMGRLEELTENWRSGKEIVEFNNRFFEIFKQTMPESGKPFYQQIIQTPRGKEGGLVTFELTQKDEESEELVLERLLIWVKTCITDGYQPHEICILAKRKADCNTYANHLKNNGYQVVSADSLLVNSDQYVQLVIAFCRLRNNATHRQLFMRFAELFLRVFSPEKAFETYQLCFETMEENGKAIFSRERFFQLTAFDRHHLSQGFQDIFSLIQNFLRDYKIDELQNAYVHQLLDLAAQFDLHNGPDLMSFLSFYDGVGYKTNVQLPENKHSIKVMTAHKSKGLEFPVVIIPSLRFDVKSPKGKARIFESNNHFLQSTLTKADAILPAIEPFMVAEKDAEIMDHINLLYVAFTRPVDRLYFMGTLAPRDQKLQQNIFDTLSELYPQFVEGKSIIGSVGTAPVVTHESKEEDLPFTPVSLNDYLWFPHISIMSPEEQLENELNTQRRFGKQFHAIMEQSMTLEQAQESIERGILKGNIDATFKTELNAHAGRLFANETYLKLISGGTQLDEQTLLVDQKTRLRPDKIILHADKTVVIDFKTGERKPEHRTQVSQYLFALDLMKFPEVEGWLYYVNEDELVRIEM
jgi:ATP-dependent exoDNAse (exonuclease V) beta subunit